MPRPLRLHYRQHGRHGVKQPFYVYVDHTVPLVNPEAGDIRNRHQPGVIKGDINMAIALVQCRHPFIHRGRVSDVHDQRHGFAAGSLNFRRQRLKAIQTAGGETNPDALFR